MNDTSGGKMDSNTLEELIRSRRSIRKWKKEKISDELIVKAIELGTWAPNGGNSQSWHFVIVRMQRSSKWRTWFRPHGQNCFWRRRQHREDMPRYQKNGSSGEMPVLLSALPRNIRVP
jgi:hypothetical protein